MPELEGRDVVTELQSMEFHLFPVSVAGGQKYPESTAQNQPHFLDCKTGNKKESGKVFYRINQDCPQTRQAEFAKNTS